MDNPFKKIIDTALNIFNNSSSASSFSDLALGIDISSSAIKIVEIKKKGEKITLETYGAIALGPYASSDIGSIVNLPTEKVVEALVEVLKQSGVSSKSGSLSVPVKSSLIFSIELPIQINKGEMRDIIATEARKYIPLPINEVSLDFFEIPKKELSFEEANNQELINQKDQKKEVLVIATQNDAISKLRAILSSSKIETDFFEVEIFSSVRSSFDHELSLVLLIDFGASSVKLSFVEFGVVKSFHMINRGSVDITNSLSKSLGVSFAKAEEYKKEFGLYENPIDKNIPEIIKVHTDYIFSKINEILLKYEKKYNRSINKVILTGGGSLLKGFKEESINNFKTEVELSSPFSKVHAPEFLEKVLKEVGPEFSVAVGLALRKLQ